MQHDEDEATEVFVDDTPVGNTERVYTDEPVPGRCGVVGGSRFCWAR